MTAITTIRIDQAALPDPLNLKAPDVAARMIAAALQGHLNAQSLNAEVFEMAGRIGIDCLTIELADVVPVLKQHGLI